MWRNGLGSVLALMALVAPTVAYAQAARPLQRVLRLPPPHTPPGAFLVLGPEEDPPRRAAVVTIQNEHAIGPSTEAPGITPARHLDVVFGAARSDRLVGTLFPCRGRVVTASRTVWLRDRLGDDRWRRGVEARASGECEPFVRYAAGGGEAFLPGPRPVRAASVEILDDEAERVHARAAVGVEQVVVYRVAGQIRLVHFARDNGWHYALLDGGAARPLTTHHVVEAYYPQSGPFVPCVGGRAYLMDRLGGAFEGPPYQLIDIGACPDAPGP